MTVLLLKRVGTLPLSSYGIMVITRHASDYRAFLIFVFIFERLSVYYVIWVRLGSVINIITVLG